MSAPVDQFTLLDKHTLAQRLGVSPDGVLKLVAMRQIPAIKLGHRTMRFSWPAVERALAKLTISEVNR
jgi:excisionase family DNA binding protein